jgi:acetoin utilization deacetylase AcuC-like enzyme
MPIPTFHSLRHWRLWDRSAPIWYDPHYRLPLTAFGKRWGIEPRRADFVAWYLLDRKWIQAGNLRPPVRARYEDIGRVHTQEYLEQLASRETLAQVFGIDPWDVPVDEVMHTIRLGVGGTIAATRESLARGGAAINLFGGFHHAAPDRGSGFCALNDIAIAVAAVRQDGFRGRVAVLDLDAHPPDGTAACLAGDGNVWIGSLSGGASTVIPGVDETVLPPGCEDDTYLAVLSALLGRMPASDLAFVVAGGDVLADDHMGGLALTIAGARRRDLRVADALRGVPTVWLPGGGYHPRSWHVLAGTVLAVMRRSRHAIDPREDPLRLQFARIYEHLEVPRQGRDSHDLSIDDVMGDLGVTASSPHLLLGTYSAEAVEYTLYRFNLLGFLERRGYGQFRVSFGTTSSGGERVMVYGRAGGVEHLLIDCVLQQVTIEAADVLYVHWLALRDPRARFSEKRPRLPGQDVPGLGLAREMTELLALMSQRLQVAGVAFKPAWYHTAYVARERFRFVDPRIQGRFEAMVRDFTGISLIEVSIAMAGGRARLNGEPYTWEAENMVSWRDARDVDAPAIAEAKARSVFTLVPPKGP